MVYFVFNRLGFNCGKTKETCQYYPRSCSECLKHRLEELGLEIEEDHLRFQEMDSKEKRIKAQQDMIWHKFLDVTNIKRIILMDLESGLAALDYPVSEIEGVDVALLSGFIQANINFSESDQSSIDTSFDSLHQFYEFQYKNFNVLLKNGRHLRICMVLDKAASSNMRIVVADFLREYEKRYWGNIQEFKKTGKNAFVETKNFLEETFNINLLHPMTLTHTIPFDIGQSIKEETLRNAIFHLSNELLQEKHYFYIKDLVVRVKNIVEIENSAILYEINQFIEQGIILPTTIERAETQLKSFQESRAKRIADNELISSIISTDEADPLEELKEQAQMLDEDTARKMMDNFLKKGKTAEKGLIYKEAQKEYEKALYIATGFGFDKDIGKISFNILELDKKIREMEVEYAITAAEKMEKRKDYIGAIKNFQKAVGLLESDPDYDEAKIKKLTKRIDKVQKNL